MKFTSLIAISLSLSACTTRLPAPELISKEFEPNRGGIIRHEQPLDGEEQRLYKRKVGSMMRKFCKGSDYKVLSESTKSEVVGSFTTGSAVFNSSTNTVNSGGYTALDRENKMFIRFECLQGTSSGRDENF